MGRKKKRYLDMEARWERARRRNLVDARPGRHSCILVLDHLKPDFNIGKIFRSGDAFGVREIHLVGVDMFDPEPAKGSVRWVPFVCHQDFSSCYRDISGRGYAMFALEPDGESLLTTTTFPARSAFILGHEEFGISFDRGRFPGVGSLSIPQWGQVQSLNVSVAASIVLYEYIRQHGIPDPDRVMKTDNRHGRDSDDQTSA